GEIELTAIQHWFFELDFPQIHHWNQATLLSLFVNVDPQIIEKAVTHLLRYHDTLRIRYIQDAGRWKQAYSEPEINGVPVPCEVIDLSDLEPAEQEQRLLEATEEAQRGLNIEQGPLLRVLYFDLGYGEPARLFIAIHHLVVDSVSWRIFLEDLLNVCAQIETQQEIQLPPKTVSFQQWSQQINAYAQEEACLQELPYWREQGQKFSVELPIDRTHGKNTVASASTHVVTLTQEETSAFLYDVPPTYQTQMNDILLTALALTLMQWRGQEQVTINLEGHGREDLCGLDVSRTMGWFTSIYPVHLDLRGCDSLAGAIKTVKEHLRTLPNHGIGYGLLRYLAPAAVQAELAALPTPMLSFNYLGQFQQVLSEEPTF